MIDSLLLFLYFLPRLLAQRLLKWLERILCMAADTPTGTVFKFDPATTGWRRPRGRPHTRKTDVLRSDLEDLGESLDRAQEMAQSRSTWRRLVWWFLRPQRLTGMRLRQVGYQSTCTV